MHTDDARALATLLTAAHAVPDTLDLPTLEAGVQRLLDGGSHVVHLTAREVLFRAGEQGDHAWVVLTGSLDEWGSELRLSIRRPGQLVGEMNVLVGGEHYTTTVEVREDVVLLAIPGDTLRGFLGTGSPLDPWLLQACAHHARSWAAAAHWETEHQGRQFFQGDEAQLAPAPYEITNATMYGFWIKMPRLTPGSPRVSQAGLHPDSPFDLVTPPGVTPLLDAYLLTVNQFPSVTDPTVSATETSRYAEVAIMVPCVVGDDPTPRMFYPYLYTGTTMAIYAGREIYGLPKMGAETYHDNDIRRLLVRGSGLNTFELRWAPLDATDAAGGVLHALREGLTEGKWPLSFDGPLLMHILTHMLRVGVDDIAACATKSLLGRESFLHCMEDKIKDALSELATVQGIAWKRIYDPGTELPPGQQVVPWKATDFQVDGISTMAFRTTAIHSLDLIEATALHTQPPFLWSDVELAFPLGVRMDYDMVMEPDSGMLVDFCSDPPDDVRRLAWGPGIWKLPEELYRASHPDSAPPAGIDPIDHYKKHPLP